MQLETATSLSIQQFLMQAKKRFPISQTILFGSRARQDNREDSDADVMLLLDGVQGDFVQTKLALADIAFDVLLDTGIRIDPLPVWQYQWQHPDAFSNPQLLVNIQHEGVEILL
jgi:antitoxin ChpS